MGPLPASRRLLVATTLLAVLSVGAFTNMVLMPPATPRLPLAVDLPAVTSTTPVTANPPVRSTHGTHARRSSQPARASVAAPRPATISTTTAPSPLTVVTPHRPVVHVDGSSDSSTDGPEGSGDGSGG